MGEREQLDLQDALDRWLLFVLHRFPQMSGNPQRAEYLRSFTGLPLVVILRIGKDCDGGLTDAENALFEELIQTRI